MTLFGVLAGVAMWVRRSGPAALAAHELGARLAVAHEVAAVGVPANWVAAVDHPCPVFVTV